MDFTLSIYRTLLGALQKHGFLFQTFGKFILDPSEKVVIMRHDVDLVPQNALRLALIENEYGIKSSYYFRACPGSWDEDIIREIVDLGHEVGYHYEDVSLAAERLKAVGGRRKDFSKKYEVSSKKYEEFERELVDIAIKSFTENLEKMRKIAPVKTICMHGSPMSKWDSRLLWKYYDYHDYGIIADFYYDVDYSSILYLTDTGRRWNGENFSVRDKSAVLQKEGYNKELILNYRFRRTCDIISAINSGRIHTSIIINTHPQRWTSRTVPWVKELVWQNVKNAGKYFLIRQKAVGGRQ